MTIAQAAQEKKAEDVLILEVGALTSIAEYFVFASGDSERQVKAIADHIEHTLASRYDTTPQVEGTGACTWILLDYGDIVVHVFRSDVRAYYGLEHMWADAPQIPVPDAPLLHTSLSFRQEIKPAIAGRQTRR
ncbi:MAG: ribosome silencing factor [Nitrospirae bacterium]|nr:MAG: ribosome silencing factor [Nitrospirota bacterium]